MGTAHMMPQVILLLPNTTSNIAALDFPCLGIIALANVIPGMGALTSLDISDNNLTNYGNYMSGKP
jgi:hypothetical protein